MEQTEKIESPEELTATQDLEMDEHDEIDKFDGIPNDECCEIGEKTDNFSDGNDNNEICEIDEHPPVNECEINTNQIDDENKEISPKEIIDENDENDENDVKKLTNDEAQIALPSEKDHDSDIADDDDENEDGPKLEFQIGRTVTLQMLLAAKLLEPGKSAMTIEYLGQKFVGDLLPDGKIKSQETETVFCSPSAWAMHCKRIVNPEKKSGCGWASIRYKNKKLNAIKTSYLRKRQQQKESNLSDEGEVEGECEIECKPDLPELEIKRIVLPFNTVNNRNIAHDPNTLVETVSFASLNKLQPFLVSITTSSVLLMDFHCHLTKQEVCGYLGGCWDINTQTLSITHAFPVRNTRHDRHLAIEVEQQIQRNMLRENLILVGWYHSHPRIAAQPTLRDCDAQLEYQIKMCGIFDENYTPCIGLICSPYYSENPSAESAITAYWVVPPAENRPMEYGRPMAMQFSVTQDIAMSEHIKNEMVLAIEYYRQFDYEMVNFDAKYDEDVTFIEKLKTTLYSKFPREQNDFEFWNWLRINLGLSPENEFTPPKHWPTNGINYPNDKQINDNIKNGSFNNLKSNDFDGEMKDFDRYENNHDLKDEKLQIRSLQEQLRLPSGLNMTPSPISSIPLLQTSKATNSISNNTVSLVSPRDSPISNQSNASPAAKFEIRPPATPSPVKSDASPRNRNSPLPTNLNKYPYQNPTLKSGGASNESTLAATKAMEELLATNFGGKLSGYSSAEYISLLQHASNKELNIAANLLGNSNDKQANDPSATMKDFLSQLEKSKILSLRHQ